MVFQKDAFMLLGHIQTPCGLKTITFPVGHYLLYSSCHTETAGLFLFPSCFGFNAGGHAAMHQESRICDQNPTNKRREKNGGLPYIT